MQLQTRHFFFDIDGTITGYRPGALDADRLLDGNFLFPIIRGLLVERDIPIADAEAMIRRECRENVFWCYGDFVQKFRLSPALTEERFRAWHEENLSVFSDTVELIRFLAGKHVPLHVVSNNPVDGCWMKLERAGLASESFRGIYGTDIMKGCKNLAGSWRRALSQAGVQPGSAIVIGDDEKEDGAVPKSCGVGMSIIIDRSSSFRVRCQNGFLHVNDAREVPEALAAADAK